jgi:hypothetical protein
MTDTLAAILDQEPDWTTLPEALPATIRRLLQRCLEKDPKRRLHDIADARIELDDARGVPATTPSASHTSAAQPRSTQWLLALVALVSLGTLSLATLVYLERAPADARAFRMTILPPANVSTEVLAPAQRLAISPDGQRLAFVAADLNGRIQLWVRPLDELDGRALPGTEDAAYPFWSPDSRFLAFYAQGKLKRIDVTGGPALTLCDAGPARYALGGTWNREGVILFASILTGQPTAGALYRVSASGGARTAVTTLDPKNGETGHWAPFFLPDGQHFLYLALGPRMLPLGIYVGSLNSNERRLVLRGGSNAKYAQGHLFFLRESTLMAQAFDVRRLGVDR